MFSSPSPSPWFWSPSGAWPHPRRPFADARAPTLGPAVPSAAFVKIVRSGLKAAASSKGNAKTARTKQTDEEGSWEAADPAVAGAAEAEPHDDEDEADEDDWVTPPTL